MWVVSEPTPSNLPGLDDFRNWKPEHQQRALELLREFETSSWKPFYCPDPTCPGNPHSGWGWEHARPDQRPPRWSDDWLTLLMSGGRGSGKTRTGSEISHQVSNHTPSIALIAATGPDLRDTMVEGDSGILACSPPGKRPLWEPSKKRLTWPNGCVALGYSAEEPDRLRGPNKGFIWGDEPAHWPLVKDVMDNALLGLRVKWTLDHKPWKPKVVLTTTPKPTPWLRELIADPQTVVHRVSTYANIQNLADTYRDTVLKRFEGTRAGRQELYGELLEDVEGALWQWDMFLRADEHPDLVRIIVSVDPAGSTNNRSDDTGIIVMGIDAHDHIWVLEDATGKYSPGVWGDKVAYLSEKWAADKVVAEKNYGGEMVERVIEKADWVGPPLRVKLVDSRRGKALRAEPIVALYERDQVTHVGDLASLEDEQTSWVPGEGASPNRVDALVHGATHLARLAMPAMVADPNKLLRDRPGTIPNFLGRRPRYPGGS